MLNSPGALTADIAGNVYIADAGSNLVRKVASDLTVSTVAGTGTASSSSDAACGGGGQASDVNLTPTGVALDGAGDLYIADLNQNRVCALNLSTGALSTVAGTGAVCASSTAACGDGGKATSAQLALDAQSGLASGMDWAILLIADSGDHRIRSVNLTTGVISTVIGTWNGVQSFDRPVRRRRPGCCCRTQQSDGGGG